MDGVSSGVSEGFVKKLKSTYDQITEENTDTDSPDFHASSQSILKGLGKRQYNYLNAVWGSDYPPTVYTWKVDGQTVVMIAEDNDGGGERHFYTNDGKWLVSGGHSESESFSWYQ